MSKRILLVATQRLALETPQRQPRRHRSRSKLSGPHYLWRQCRPSPRRPPLRQSHSTLVQSPSQCSDLNRPK